MRPVLQLTCSVLVPSDSTTVTVDWYWSKNISECGRYITEEQGRFTIYASRGYNRIVTDLYVLSPQNDTGYYWCQVNDPSYNGIFISSNKAPVFDTGTMTICSGTQYTNQSICAVGSSPSLMCIRSTTTTVSTSTYAETTAVSPTSYGVVTSILLDTIFSTSFRITSTLVNGISNTPVPSSQTSSITTIITIVVSSVPSGFISNTPVSSSQTSSITTTIAVVVPSISSGVISNTPVLSDRTSNNTTTVIVVVVTVLILLATLILVIAAVIIIIFIVIKRQPDRSKSLFII